MSKSDFVYLDTSAYLSILLMDSGFETLIDQTQGCRLCTSIVMFLEAERNLIRLAREKILNGEDHLVALKRVKKDIELFYTLDLNFETLRWGEFPTVSLPRTMDLIHLRAARFFDQEYGLTQFITLDKHQLRSAEEFGLPTSRK